MIFDSSKLGNTIAYMIQSYTVDGDTQGSVGTAYRIRVVVGSGSQPTPAQVEANWSTEYYLNDTGNTGTAGNSILCGYGDLWVDASVNDVIWENDNTGNTAPPRTSNLYLGTTIPQSYYFKNGTANYAIIWFNEALTMSSNSFPSDNFMIVPVTDIFGTGVVKLESINITNSAPVLASINLNVSGGV